MYEQDGRVIFEVDAEAPQLTEAEAAALVRTLPTSELIGWMDSLHRGAHMALAARAEIDRRMPVPK